MQIYIVHLNTRRKSICIVHFNVRRECGTFWWGCAPCIATLSSLCQHTYYIDCLRIFLLFRASVATSSSQCQLFIVREHRPPNSTPTSIFTVSGAFYCLEHRYFGSNLVTSMSAFCYSRRIGHQTGVDALP